MVEGDDYYYRTFHMIDEADIFRCVTKPLIIGQSLE